MTTVNPPTNNGHDSDRIVYPVDSTTRTCCGGIGRHTPDCVADVKLPPGASPGDGGWAMWDNEYRIIYGTRHTIPGSPAWVEASAVQFPDGSLDTAEGPSRSAPAVSIEASCYDYLTSGQARELAGALNAAADELDTWQYDKHDCPFDWCTTPPGSRDRDDHWYTTYASASLLHSDPYHLSEDKDPLRVGTGVTYTEGQIPAVILHLDGGACDYDADAFMRIDEAKNLRDALNEAIDRAAEAMDHFAGPKGIG